MLGKQNLFGKRDESAGPRDPRSGSYGPAATNTAAGQVSNPLLPTSASAANSNANATPPAPAAGTAKASERSGEPQSENRLIVGPDVKLKGAEILDCDTLVVEGRVEATMDSRVINIAEKGSFSGKVGIDVAEIHGSFDGELVARHELIIHATGRVNGKIRYGKILIESGGELSGDVRSLASDSAKLADNLIDARPARVAAVDIHPAKSLATLS